MKYLLSSILFITLFINNTSAQKKGDERVISDLNLKWEIVENFYNNKPQALAALTLNTHSPFSLPTSGWKLYFNFDEPVIPESVTGNLTVTHVNGDLYYLSPRTNFSGLNANESLRIEMVALNWLINMSDTPHGFYLVWDKAPNVPYWLSKPLIRIPSTQPKQFMRVPGDMVPVSTPEWVYEQNKNIRDIPADSLIKIFPTPHTYQKTSAVFNLDAGVIIDTDPSFKSEATLLKSELRALLIQTNIAKSQNQIKLVKKAMVDEAYELQITNNTITIAASTGSGIFYGIQSLKTLLPAQAWHEAQKSIAVPGIIVTDKPRFAYRAFMLDVGRNFQGKFEILKLLDVMSLYKLNVFHFHLTDDEGWRLEIPSLPELTAVGAKRGHTLNDKENLQPALGSGPFVSRMPGSGYYTKADFMEILKYATQRHITVIPEIESPGHARAAIKAMDARYAYYLKKGNKAKAEQYSLHDQQDSSKYSSVQYYDDNVINLALPSTYTFMETVTSEIKKMYTEAGAPLKTIHFGGDEVPAGVWEKSPAFFRLMKADTSIKVTDDLWTYYYTRINKLMQAHNLYLSGWEEVGTKKIMQDGKKQTIINPDLANKDIHLEVWNNVLGWGSEDLAYKLANRGYKVILSPVTNLYFDMAYNKSFNEEGYYWGGYADIDRLFSFIPLDYFKNTVKGRLGEPLSSTAFAAKERPTATGTANIVGLQGALWSETIGTYWRMEYMLLPKLLGLAERAWAKNPQWATETDTTKSKALYNEAWSYFVNVTGKQELPRLTYYAGGFNYRIPAPGVSITNGQVWVNTQLPGLEIHYSTDGKVPGLTSMHYTGPISTKDTIKIGLFNKLGRYGEIVTVINN